jgi:PAS domain S-box-containing protein
MIRVLMVDDDPIILELTKTFLEKSGDMEVDPVPSARAALKQLSTGASCYDVVVSDYAMPEMDGITFLKKVRDGVPEIPFILFTGRSREEVAIEALNFGADYYLQKDGGPALTFAELSHIIRLAADRCRAKRALKESEERYRTFVENVPGIAFRKPPGSAPTFVHGQVEAITGYSEEDFSEGRVRWSQLIHPDDLPKFVEINDRLMTRPGATAKRFYRIFRKDGEIRWIYETARNVQERGDGPPEVEGIVHDVTDRKRARRQLLLQRDMSLKLSETTSLAEALKICLATAIEISDMDCGTIYLLDEKSGDLRLAHSSGLGEDFLKAVSNQKRNSKRFRMVMEGRSVYIRLQDSDLPLQKARMREGIRSIAVVPILHQERVIGCYSIGSHARNRVPIASRTALKTIASMIGNAIARIRATEALGERTAELEAKNAEMERFVYTVSHDLRSPLMAMRGFAACLREEVKEGDRRGIEDYLARMDREAARMDRLLTSALELSRIGRVASPPEEVAFEEIAFEALAQTEEAVRSRGIEVSVAEGLPAVSVDRMRLVEALVNLIENSVKYAGDGPRPKIDIGFRCEGDGLPAFFVRDNGPGIDPDQQEKVFELFYKIDRKSAGTGAGLAIVKRIIEVHGGRIWIESEPGRGCSVCFTLPPAEKEAETCQ